MSRSTQRSPLQTGPRTSVEEVAPWDGDELLCQCCEPANPLVLRPDLGITPEGAARYALCVFHLPEPVVYLRAASGDYAPAPGLSLDALGQVVDAEGAVVARVEDAGFQRLSTVDDDDLPDEPSGGGALAPPSGGSLAAPHAATHVDLSQDEFYGAGAPGAARSR